MTRSKGGMLMTRHRCRLPLIGGLACVLAGCPVWAKEKAVFWQPYPADVDTVALYHLDAANLPEGAGGGVDALDGPVDEDAQAVVNAAPMGEAATLAGACAQAPDGKFHGALRLTGADGRLSCRSAGGQGWTLEGWFRAARLPQERATLVDLPAGKASLRVSLLANGTLAVTWMGGEIAQTAWTCPLQTWFHLALVWQPVSRHDGNVTAAKMLLLVDGRPVLDSGTQRTAVFAPALRIDEATLGNTADGAQGFDGWLDEVRISSIARDYYLPDLDWVDASGARPSPTGQPFFRDAADLLFQLPFNTTLQPARAGESVKLAKSLHVTPEAIAIEPKKFAFRYADGVERQGLLLTAGERAVEYSGLTAVAQRGAVAFWSWPVDWNNEQLWSNISGLPQLFAAIFRLTQGGKSVMQFDWVKTPDADYNPNAINLHPGRWMHLALTWENGKLQAYLNGKVWAHGGAGRWQYTKWDDTKPLTLTFPATASATYVDDFRLYRRALASSEIANLVALANWGKERVEAEVRLDPNAMGFGDVPPARLVVKDVDRANLIKKVFDADALKEPNEVDIGGADTILDIEHDPDEIEVQRVAADGAVTWQAGVLRCAVRRHDYRLFVFTRP
jgi:hypothetical protein